MRLHAIVIGFARSCRSTCSPTRSTASAPALRRVNEPYIAYSENKQRVLDYQEYGTQYLLGLNYRF